MEIANFLDEMFDKAWKDTSVLPISRKFILPYLPQLMTFNRFELLSYSLSNRDIGDNISLLLCVPEIWESMKLEDWSTLARMISPRPTFRAFEPTGYYSDIVFFIKWLNLDGLKFALSLDISEEDKKLICQYCFFDYFLQLDDKDFDDFDDQVYCSLDLILEHRAKLLVEDPSLLPTYSNQASFSQYAKNICHI
jgi:hypothetical protein